MNYPSLIVNFKTYEASTGDNSIELARVLAQVRGETGKEVIAAPQFVDLRDVGKIVPSFSQHIDPVPYGSNTGSVLPESVKAAEAVGTLINHSERKVGLDFIQEAVAKAKELGLASCVCAADTEEAKGIAEFGPDMIAVEPPELIGSGISVSKARPEVVSDSVKAIKEINSGIRVLCGAGVSTGEDVRKAILLGAEGVLVASAIVNSQDSYKITLEMANGLGGEK